MKKSIITVILITKFKSLFCQMVSEKEFTNLFFEKLSEKVEDISIQEISNLKIITLKDEEERQHFLNNAYNNYKLSQGDLDEILENFANSSASIYQKTKPFDISKVVPIIKDKRYLEGLSEIRNGEPAEEVYEKYNSELFIFYALDLEYSINYFSQTDMTQAGYNLDKLKKVAIENLYEIIEPINRNGENQFYMIMCGGNYESSLILDSELWNKENFPVDGDILIGIPSRDLVFITGSKNQENVNKLKETIQDVDAKESNLVSNKMYILKNGKFELYKE